MEDNNIDIKNIFLKNSKVKSLVNTIKIAPPVQKINFNTEDVYHTVGMYLLTTEDLLSVKVDKSDLNDQSILYISQSATFSCISCIHGALNLLVYTKIISEDIPKKYIMELLNYIGNGYIEYTKFNPAADLFSIINDAIIDDSKKIILKNFNFIVANIWYMPYNEIDRLGELCKEELKNGE